MSENPAIYKHNKADSRYIPHVLFVPYMSFFMKIHDWIIYQPHYTRLYTLMYCILSSQHDAITITPWNSKGTSNWSSKLIGEPDKPSLVFHKHTVTVWVVLSWNGSFFLSSSCPPTYKKRLWPSPYILIDNSALWADREVFFSVYCSPSRCYFWDWCSSWHKNNVSDWSPPKPSVFFGLFPAFYDVPSWKTL